MSISKLSISELESQLKEAQLKLANFDNDEKRGKRLVDLNESIIEMEEEISEGELSVGGQGVYDPGDMKEQIRALKSEAQPLVTAREDLSKNCDKLSKSLDDKIKFEIKVEESVGQWQEIEEDNEVELNAPAPSTELSFPSDTAPASNIVKSKSFVDRLMARLNFNSATPKTNESTEQKNPQTNPSSLWKH